MVALAWHEGAKRHPAWQVKLSMAARKLHWWRHAGHTPPLSNVFHSWPQVQDQRSSLRGDQPHCGHRMRGPDGLTLLSWSRSRSKTGDDLAESERGHMPSYYGALARLKKGRHPRCQFSTDL